MVIVAIHTSEDGTQSRVAKVAKDTPERGDMEAQKSRISGWEGLLSQKPPP